MTSTRWKVEPEVAKEALKMLRDAKLVLMPTHQNADADALASTLAVSMSLRELGIDARPLVSDGQMPVQLGFLPGIDTVLVYGSDELPGYDLLCLIDCSDLRRLGDFYADDPSRLDGHVPIINIDHHVTNSLFGTVNIVDPAAASAAEIVTNILAIWGTQLNREIAQCLLAGIYGDTLGLRTESTTSKTMRIAADLVDAGANPAPIVDALFRVKPKSSVCLWETALRNVEWTDTVIWTELTRQAFEDCGAHPSEAEGLVNFLLGTEGSTVAAILYANDNGWRVSMRSMSSDVDVAAIAAVFGGGGHPRASGCQITGDESDKATFLARVAELANEGRTDARTSVKQE